MSIGTLNEGPLHAALKAHYQRPGDRTEVHVDGREIDLVRGDELVEIQTSGFTQLKRKIASLIDEHPLRLVHPVPKEKWIVRIAGGEERAEDFARVAGGRGQGLRTEDGEVLGRRKSPKRGRALDAFEHLVSLWHLAAHPNFSFEVALTQEEEVRRHEAGRVWRRKGWVIVERRLIDVVETRAFTSADDYRALIPRALPARFTTAELAEGLSCTRERAQQLAYFLRRARFVDTDQKRGNAIVYVNPWRA